MFNGIKVGNRVRFLIPNGIGRNGAEYKEKNGTAAMVSSSHVVCNGGGKHGTPYVVNDSNYVSHKSGK